MKLRDHRFFFNMIWLIILITIPLPLIITVDNGLETLSSSSEIMGINFGVCLYLDVICNIFINTAQMVR